MNKILSLLLFTLLCSFCLSGQAYEEGREARQSSVNQAEQDCKNIISVHCAKTPSAVFSEDGLLWLVFVQGDFVYITQSADKGLHFSKPLKVNKVAETVYSKGENRPKIQLGTKGEIYVSWSKKQAGRFTGDIRFSRSLDGGESFEAVKTINDDNLLTGHRFDELMVNEKGDIYLAWIDKRDQFKAKKNGQAYKGAAIYFSVSNNSGQSFSKNSPVAEHSCECCRMAMTEGPNHSAVLLWRHIFSEGARDHSLAQLKPDSSIEKMSRPARDDWKINACPHHGPDLDSDEAEKYHLAWYNNGEKSPGLQYGLYDFKSKSMLYSRVMDAQASAGHPQVKKIGPQVYFIWKTFDGEKTHIQLAISKNNGRDWSGARSIAKTTLDSDHPLLLSHEGKAYMSWMTGKGYRFLELPKS